MNPLLAAIVATTPPALQGLSPAQIITLLTDLGSSAAVLAGIWFGIKYLTKFNSENRAAEKQVLDYMTSHMTRALAVVDSISSASRDISVSQHGVANSLREASATLALNSQSMHETIEASRGLVGDLRAIEAERRLDRKAFEEVVERLEMAVKQPPNHRR